MPFISTLDVINAMLSGLGESPLNTLDSAHPLVAAGTRMIGTANLREQGKSWWFNKELVQLTPDADTGYIYCPDDSLRVDPTQGTLNYVQRGRRLYKAYAPGTDPYKFTQTVLCWLVRLVPFDDLPPSAQLLVSYSAQREFSLAYDADKLKYQVIDAAYKEALIDISAEHIRNVNANMFRREGVANIINQVTPRFTGNQNVLDRL